MRIDNKQRLGLLEDDGELFIRANQGHSVEVRYESCIALSPCIGALFASLVSYLDMHSLRCSGGRN